MKKWLENIKFDCLNSDPYLICVYKLIRRNIRIHTNLIKVLAIISLISFGFTVYIEPLIKDYLWFKTLLMILNLITFIGVFYPLSIKKNLTKNDVKNTIDKKKEEDRINKRFEDMSSL
jgi:hypothetical protein